VIRSDGSLGGYGGGLHRKVKLLTSEGHVTEAPELPLAD
jgi:O6-methylguanine-DNA--protein-cysteine methyltransferase